MATRKPPIEPTEGDAAEAPGVIPAGVDADVTVKYRRRVNPPEDQINNNGDDLNDLALEVDADLSPPDPLAAFLEEWSRYAGYNCEVVRLPDPADRRMISNQYARPNFSEFERLGGMPFDPITFISSLQYVNGNSGGVFRVWLTDQTGQMIPGARLERVAISDPPGAHKTPVTPPPAPTVQQPTPAPPPQKSEGEQKLDQIKDKLFMDALSRALNPPPPPPPAAPALSDEQQLATILLTKTDLLSGTMAKVADALNTERPASNSWTDKAMDFMRENPNVAVQVTSAAERIVIGVTNLLGNLIGQPPGQPAPPQTPPPTQHAPAATAAATQAATNLPPEAPQPQDAEDDEDMAILDELFAMLNDTREITGEDEVFKTLQRDHPIKFKMYVRMIASADETQIIEFVSGQSPLYESLLSSPVTGPHLRQRLEVLRQLCIKAVTPPPAPPAPAPEQPATATE